MTKTIAATAIAANDDVLPMVGHPLKTLKASADAADTIVTGATSVMLWADQQSAIMRLTVTNDQPLTLAQLVRAIQCGYLVSAQRASRWGEYAGVVGEHVAMGCRISTDAMPHEVEYQPNWKVAMSADLMVDGYEAKINDGRLDVMLRIAA